MTEDITGRLLPESVAPAAHIEKAALREIQLVLGRRTASAAFALVFAALVFACLPEEVSPLVLVFRKGGAWLAAVLCAVSLGFWWRFYQACVRLNSLGLYRRPRGIRASWNWELAGLLVAIAIAVTVCALSGWRLRSLWAVMLPGFFGPFAARWLGRRLRHIPDYDTAREEDLANRSILLKDDG